MEDIWDLQLFACLFLVAFFKAGKKGSVCSVDTVYPVIVYNISVSLVHWFVPFIGGQKEKIHCLNSVLLATYVVNSVW